MLIKVIDVIISTSLLHFFRFRWSNIYHLNIYSVEYIYTYIYIHPNIYISPDMYIRWYIDYNYLRGYLNGIAIMHVDLQVSSFLSSFFSQKMKKFFPKPVSRLLFCVHPCNTIYVVWVFPEDSLRITTQIRTVKIKIIHTLGRFSWK